MDEFERMAVQLHQAAIEELIKEIKREGKNSGIQMDTDKLNEFKDIILELTSIGNKYKDKISQLRTSTEKEIIKYEYSKGDETIHRGDYCPSPILDLIVGNLKRGRLFKRTPAFGRYSYEYGFDTNNRLLRIRGVNEFTTPNSRFNEEYLVYIKDVVYGIEFDNMGDISAVSRCTYEKGNIIKYEICLYSMEELYYEEYYYKDNLLSEVSVFNAEPQIELCQEQNIK